MRPLPQEYGLTVGGIQRYKRLTVLSYFAYLLIMLEATSAYPTHASVAKLADARDLGSRG
jgi:hypothetical protein